MRSRSIGEHAGIESKWPDAGQLTSMRAFLQDEVDDEGGARQFRAGSVAKRLPASLVCLAAERLQSSRAGSVGKLLMPIRCAGFSALRQRLLPKFRRALGPPSDPVEALCHK